VPPSPNKHPDPLSVLQGILYRQTPLLDVRAAIEFDQGAVPHSVNLPILNDHERAAVGTTYKQSGQDAALAKGHSLVSGAAKAERIDGWLTFVHDHPEAKIMCWRGGQRSKIAQSWLLENGCDIERVPGGYKALRQTCMTILEKAAAAEKPWWVVAGRTGVQKTVLIKKLVNSIDLEGLANHRGSAFGAQATPQPPPASFENHVACEYLQHPHNALVLEDESRTIGRLALPCGWHERMQQAPLILVEADLADRVDHIVEEYVTLPLASGTDPQALENQYRTALSRIKRRLGGALYDTIDGLIEGAFVDNRSHFDWVESLMQNYYDPMYDYQLKNKAARIVFQGPFGDVQQYLQLHAN
jgi:tRNA 2-selenouridine synthase